ncbi:MAG TPA: HEAT repeat domain-containing protein [Candidatus Norongarragalinales archaeon]|jgi:hypothetical protein|nr:HEAT repeat domain-containing protein [Candidatus Norongarragalinales archaeon]
MSKIEKFLTTGHPKNVIAHLQRMRSGKLVAEAVRHGSADVGIAAINRLEELDTSQYPSQLPLALARLANTSSAFGLLIERWKFFKKPIPDLSPFKKELLKVFQTKDWISVSQNARAVAEILAPIAPAELIKAGLVNSRGSMQSSVTDYLIQNPHPIRPEAAASLLDHKDPSVRYYAIMLLSHGDYTTHARKYASKIGKIFLHEEDELRKNRYITALARIGSQAALPALREKLKREKKPYIAENIRKTIDYLEKEGVPS